MSGDPESHHGTVYKVTYWQPLGFTAGFSRHRADFYTDEDKPKKLLVMELARNARALLGSPAELPAGCLPGVANGVANGVAGARCSLKCPQLKTLAQALHAVPDPRSPLTSCCLCDRNEFEAHLLGEYFEVFFAFPLHARVALECLLFVVDSPTSDH